jgi:hypothetical protein
MKHHVIYDRVLGVLYCYRVISDAWRFGEPSYGGPVYEWAWARNGDEAMQLAARMARGRNPGWHVNPLTAQRLTTRQPVVFAT